MHTGSTLMNEAEFLQWVKRIQALRPTPPSSISSSSSSTSSSNDEEVRLDIIAAFRVFDRDKNGFITKVLLAKMFFFFVFIFFK
jgi:hypothetical protein